MSTQNNSQQPQDPNRLRLGGAWIRKGNPDNWFSVSLTKAELDKLPVDSRGNVSFQLYLTKEKNSDKSPDYNAVGSKVLWTPNSNKPAPTAKPATKAVTKPAAKPAPAPAPAPEEDVEDVL